jgi:hypothetical protein
MQPREKVKESMWAGSRPAPGPGEGRSHFFIRKA